jgi:hypothetical protein
LGSGGKRVMISSCFPVSRSLMMIFLMKLVDVVTLSLLIWIFLMTYCPVTTLNSTESVVAFCELSTVPEKIPAMTILNVLYCTLGERGSWRSGRIRNLSYFVTPAPAGVFFRFEIRCITITRTNPAIRNDSDAATVELNVSGHIGLAPISFSLPLTIS